MKNRTTVLNTILATVLGVVLLVSILAKAFCPQMILLEIDIPYMVAVSLAALVLTHFVKTEGGCAICEAVLAAITFAVLPLIAGMTAESALKLALCGGVVFAVVNAMFTGIEKRMELTDAGKCAIIPVAFGLFLASQCFGGWIL